MKSKKIAQTIPKTNILTKSKAMTSLVAQALLTGQSQEEIAAKLNTSQTTISRIASKEECKTMIEEQTRILLSKLPDVIQLIHSDITLSQKIADYYAGKSAVWPVQGIIEPKDLLSLYNTTYRKAQDLLKSSGILPGATSSVVISQVFHNESTTVLTPMAQKMLDKFAGTLVLDAELVDAEKAPSTEGENDKIVKR